MKEIRQRSSGRSLNRRNIGCIRLVFSPARCRMEGELIVRFSEFSFGKPEAGFRESCGGSTCAQVRYVFSSRRAGAIFFLSRLPPHPPSDLCPSAFDNTLALKSWKEQNAHPFRCWCGIKTSRSRFSHRASRLSKTIFSGMLARRARSLSALPADRRPSTRTRRPHILRSRAHRSKNVD